MKKKNMGKRIAKQTRIKEKKIKQKKKIECVDLFTFVVVIVSITGSQRRRSPLDKSHRRKTEYTLATALHLRVPYRAFSL